MESISFAVVGLGRIGLSHAKTIQEVEGLHLAAVCDVNEQVFANDAVASPQITRFSDYQQLLEAQCCDMVVLSIPSHLHYQMTLEALNAGCHVLVEKPVAADAQEAAEMASVAQRLGKHLTVHQSMRYWGDVPIVKDLLDSGKLGEVFQIYRGQHFGGPPREDWQIWHENNGGLLSNIGTHFVDSMLHVADKTPACVSASAQRIRDQGDTEDHFKITMSCSDGAVLECEALRATQGKAFWHICGTKGSAYAADDLPMFRLDVKLFNGESWSQSYDFAQETESAMRRYYDDLARSLTTGQPLPVSIQSVCQQMQVLDAARASIAHGQQMVQLEPLVSV